MNEIIKIMILSTILTFFGCSNKEKRFLQKNKVILCCASANHPECQITLKALEFEKKHKITFSEASIIYTNFLIKNKELDSVNSKVIPTLIINENYVYSFKNLKMSKVAVFGTGVDANTGKIVYCNDKNRIWLYENDLLKEY